MSRFRLKSCLFLATACACAAADPPAHPAIAVFLHFDRPPSAVTIAQMKQDVSRLIGAGVEWRMLRDSKGEESFDDLAVIRFRGTCRSDPLLSDLAGPPSAGTPLGSAELSDDRVTPFAEVQCDQVRRLLGPDIQEPGFQRQWEYGRALARVVAHELYHILGKTTRHARKGLAKSSQTIRELGSRSFDFDDRASQALHRSLAPK